MEAINTAERGIDGRVFTALPIDASRGFPQTFPVLYGGRTFHFSLYVNVPAAALDETTDYLELPSGDAFMVAHVERETAGGQRETVFLRKVVPGLVYEFDTIAVVFTRQRVARRNLNGRGDFGSQVNGGIAPRWAS
jgi:hypothetical protein